MKTASIVFTLGIGAAMSAAPSMAADTLIQFDGGIGVIPVSSGQGQDPTATTVNRNIVRTVQPPGQIWVIKDLKADVRAGGAITVNGKGLLLGGGSNIGGNANQSVFATLICEPTAPFTLRNTNTSGVALAPDGDFRIDDVLNPAPSDCASPVLLIRNLAGAWFAAGIPKRSEREPDSSQMRSPFGL